MGRFGSERLFHLFNNSFMVLFSLSMIAPMIHLAAVSFSSALYAGTGRVYFWPKEFHTGVYREIVGMTSFWKSMGVSIYITSVGTLVALFLTCTLAYSLSRPAMPFRGLLMRGILLTFIFSIPLIPFFLVVRSTGMYNSLWALMIPNALSAFNVIIMKTFFQGLSSEYFDAAKLDGCGEFRILCRIVVPLSMPVIATITLFHSVYQWNSYFNALIFIRSTELFPLQLLLRNLVMDEDASMLPTDIVTNALRSTPEMMKAGIILTSTLPILILYPFLQKYFVKGSMLGSLKE